MVEGGGGVWWWGGTNLPYTIQTSVRFGDFAELNLDQITSKSRSNMASLLLFANWPQIKLE